MEVQNLKSGMVVELRDGSRYVVMVNEGGAIGINIKDDYTIVLSGSYGIELYKKDLKHSFNKMRDVVKIGQIRMDNFTRMTNDFTPIWERDEPKKMTVSEICKELGYEVEIVKE